MDTPNTYKRNLMFTSTTYASSAWFYWGEEIVTNTTTT